MSIIIRGGQTTLNPWPLIGGVAIASSDQEDLIMPNYADVGDQIVLTKPLGTQVIASVSQ